MHLSEFKAWFLGYTEEMTGSPNKAQWAKIRKRVAEITADYTPPAIFIDRHYRPYGPWWTMNTYTTETPAYSVSNAGTTNMVYLTSSDWTAAGRAEYKAEHPA